MAHRIWPGTRALAQMHLDQGQRVWLVTAAPIEIATIIARRLGLTGALGTVAEHVDGVYTGRLVGEMLHGPAKARGGQGARRPRGARPRALLGVLRLLQRPADAHRWSATRARSTPTPGCAPTPGTTAGGSATTAPAARPPGSALVAAPVAGAAGGTVAAAARDPPRPRRVDSRPQRVHPESGLGHIPLTFGSQTGQFPYIGLLARRGQVTLARTGQTGRLG